MGIRKPRNGKRGFPMEVNEHFRFLVDGFDMAEPTVDDVFVLEVSYEGPGFGYGVYLDTFDREWA